MNNEKIKKIAWIAFAVMLILVSYLMHLYKNARYVGATRPAKIAWCHCEPNGNCQSLELPWQALENAGHVNSSGNPLHADDHAGECSGPTVSITPTIDATGTPTAGVSATIAPTATPTNTSEIPISSVTPTVTQVPSVTPTKQPEATSPVSEEEWNETRRQEGSVYGANK